MTLHIAMKLNRAKPEEVMLYEALAEAPGVRVSLLQNKADRCDCDLYSIIGVKHSALMKAFEKENIPYLFWDKGYNRNWPLWWRVSYRSHQPTDWLNICDFPIDRAKAQGWHKFSSWRQPGEGCILLAGASAKYHIYHGLPDPTAYAIDVIEQIKKYSSNRIVYRPKPSWKDARAVEGAHFSVGIDFARDLNKACVLVTHGSAACVDALRAGVPAVVLGHGVTRDISSTSLTQVDRPMLASNSDRMKILRALAYFQYSLPEIKDGVMLPLIHSMIAERAM